jgi:NADH-quinone oxidoreductase subunit H
VTLFLGGWRAPWPISAIGDGYFNTGWWPLLWFVAKVLLLLYVFIWLRGTLPRLRYDQFMALGWKVLLPVSLLWIFVVAALRLVTTGGVDRQTIIYWGAGITALLLVLAMLPARRPQGPEPSEPAARGEGFDAFAAGYPVPPMPGQVPGNVPGPVPGWAADQDATPVSTAAAPTATQAGTERPSDEESTGA